ncbi:hypothetical protein HYR69_11245, partial [Candidatus Sumerlaeota bacterium]|nr:hypothetical protein [Candidatus Sumerlaeota bacterium]
HSAVKPRTPQLAGIILLFWVPAFYSAAQDRPPVPFIKAKTIFQVNSPYDPRIAIAADGVIVHRHGDKIEPLRGAIQSWKDHGYSVGRMFFADSDARNEYWKGEWDGSPHPDEVERDRSGKEILCAGVRPYMLPTDGWIKYLEEMTRVSVEAGADAILPEEPLAHIFTGYEDGFKELWRERYGIPWRAEREDEEARYLTGQLKTELYSKLEGRLAELTHQLAGERKREIPFIMPVHGLYSNIASRLTAPLGSATQMKAIDGYIGQVWTGPVNWAINNYDSEQKSFFGSAYLLYDYFNELSAGSGRRMWLLTDPVEDNPKHTWDEFARWYKECVVAQLFFTASYQYEVMPWPERIFLPGGDTGGGTPAPENFRIQILSAVQMFQELPMRGEWLDESGRSGTASRRGGIGIAVTDSMMWEAERTPRLQELFGMMMPLAEAGVDPAACVMERAGEKDYLARFRVIALDASCWRPESAEINSALAQWVRRGGCLLVLGPDAEAPWEKSWWREKGFRSPMEHLERELNLGSRMETAVEEGWVTRSEIQTRDLGRHAEAREGYLSAIDAAWKKSWGGTSPARGAFIMRRGEFIAVHAAVNPVKLTGPLIDLFDPQLRIQDGADLKPGTSSIFRQVNFSDLPRVLHATHRLMAENRSDGKLSFSLRGPGETPAIARIWLGETRVGEIAAHDSNGRPVAAESRSEGGSMLLRFPNDPQGVNVSIALTPRKGGF